MRKKVYVETSVPSFYFETRAGADMRAMRQWTRTWWDKHRDDHELCTGTPVIAELNDAPEPKRGLTLGLIGHLPRLEFTDEVKEIVAVYFAHKLMPRGTYGDAAHLALASFHKCDFLLTWNCKHLANSNKTEHIDRINALLRLKSPYIVTPMQLLDDDYTL